MMSLWWRIRELQHRLENLKVLTIDITNLYCPIGCCRTNVVRMALRVSLALTKADVEVRVLGVKGLEEWDIVNEWRFKYLPEPRKAEAKLKTQCQICLSWLENDGTHGELCVRRPTIS